MLVQRPFRRNKVSLAKNKEEDFGGDFNERNTIRVCLNKEF